MRVDVRKPLSIAALTLGLVTLAAVATVRADQPPEPDTAALTRKIRPGDRLTVTTRDLARIRGKLVAVQGDSLIVATESGERQVPFTSLERVGRQRHGMWLGPIIGAGVGIGFAIPVAMLFENEGADATKASAFLIGLGAGIGLLVDAAVDLPRTVYRRDARPKVMVAPQIGRRGGGVAMQVTF
jgi:hypothetical protein